MHLSIPDHQQVNPSTLTAQIRLVGISDWAYPRALGKANWDALELRFVWLPKQPTAPLGGLDASYVAAKLEPEHEIIDPLQGDQLSPSR